MNITILVPTFKRVKDLERCLDAIKRQSHPAHEVLVIVRSTDDATKAFLSYYDSSCLPIEILYVEMPGVIAAMNVGLERCSGDIVAITDDDAEPHPSWLHKIRDTFLMDEKIGALGGRDLVYHPNQQEPISSEDVTVGELQWFGRIIGNHHIGTGELREVDFLKGVNSSYRRTAIKDYRFDERLKGSGAQVHHEIGLCLFLKRQGWKVIYDPSILVNHYPAMRLDEDQRWSFNFNAYYNASYNKTFIIFEHFSKPRLFVYFLWSLIIGSQGSFGLTQAVRFLRSQKTVAFQKFAAATFGHLQSFQDRIFLYSK